MYVNLHMHGPSLLSGKRGGQVALFFLRKGKGEGRGMGGGMGGWVDGWMWMCLFVFVVCVPGDPTISLLAASPSDGDGAKAPSDEGPGRALSRPPRRERERESQGDDVRWAFAMPCEDPMPFMKGSRKGSKSSSCRLRFVPVEWAIGTCGIVPA